MQEQILSFEHVDADTHIKRIDIERILIRS